MPDIYWTLGLALLAVAIGAMFGWRVRRNADRERLSLQQAEISSLMTSLQTVTLDMAADVGRHNMRVQEISDKLVTVDPNDQGAVRSAVSQLIELNEQMQRKLSEAEQRLERQARQIAQNAAEARTDALTGLANRRAFDQAMQQGRQQFIQHKTPFSLMLLDVDHFKQFNDNHGHQAGDAVLKGVADSLRHAIGGKFTVARYGGEEFAVLFHGCAAKEAESRAEAARRAIAAASFEFEGQTLAVTACVGLAQMLEGETESDLLRRADEALYQSKRGGRNCGHGHDGKALYPLGARKAAASAKVFVKSASPSPPPLLDPWLDGGDAQPEGAKEEAALSARFDEFPIELYTCEAFRTDVSRRLTERNRGGAGVAIAMVRIDGWNELSQRRGESTAALVRRAATHFFKAAMRDLDHVGQWRADTYGILLPMIDLEEAVAIGERIRRAVSRCRLPSPGGEFGFTVSVGAGEALDGEDAAALLQRVERACEAACEQGGNGVFLDQGDGPRRAEAEEALAPTA